MIMICKKCGRKLPSGYKHKCCESCRILKIDKIKDIGKKGAIALGVVVTVAAALGKAMADNQNNKDD